MNARQVDASYIIQLEGALELIGRARKRYDVLLWWLALPGWRRRLRLKVGLLRATRGHEAGLLRALDRVERRAVQEQWPEHHPSREAVRALRARRNQLERLVRGRLAQAGSRSAVSLLEGLEQLETLVLTPVPRVSSDDELVLLQGRQGYYQRSSRVYAWGAVLAIALFALSFPLGFLVTEDAFLVCMMASLAVPLLATLVVHLLPRGRYWLTAERLVWKPPLGERVQVRLASIPPDGIHLLPAHNGVRVVGGEGMVLVEDVPRAAHLADMLRLRRDRAVSSRTPEAAPQKA